MWTVFFEHEQVYYMIGPNCGISTFNQAVLTLRFMQFLNLKKVNIKSLNNIFALLI